MRKKSSPQKSKNAKPVASKGSRATVTASLMKAVWPLERDFLERPERYKYVRKLLPVSGCVFCESVKKGPSAETLVLRKNPNTVVIMNKYPYNTGHLLILPLKHIGNIWDIDEKTTAEMSDWMKRSARILTEALKCPGFNAGLNHGSVAGAGLPEHLHWHIVPRWGGDTNFFPLIAETKVLPETIDQTYNRLKPLFDDEKV